MGPERSPSLLALACLFLAFGLTGLSRFVASAYRGVPPGSIDFSDLAYVAIGVALLRHAPLGRRGALVAVWLRIFLTCLPLAYMLHPPWMNTLSLFGKPLRFIPRSYVLAYVVVSFTIAVWALRVLQNSRVRALFTSREPSVRSAAQAS